VNATYLYLLVALFPAIAVSLLILGAGATAIWSRDPERRLRADRLFRLLVKAAYPLRRR